MANDFSIAEERFFEGVHEFFESEPSVVQKTNLYTEDGTRAARGNYTFWRPQQQISRVVTGLDISGSYADVTELMYPATITTADIKNVPFTLDAVELNDEFRLKQKTRSVAGALLGSLDTAVADTVAKEGSLCVRVVGDADTYLKLAEAEAVIGEAGIPLSTDRCMALGHRNWYKVAGDLAGSNGQFSPRTGDAAYTGSSVPPIAGFDTFRAQYLPTLTAQAQAITVTGGGQKHVPVSNNATSDLLQDNRRMTLTVSSTTGILAGAAFTLASVNRLEAIRKTDTGQLQTFRVVSITDATNMVITPAIIVDGGGTDAEDTYANCSASPAGASAVTFLNDDANTVPVPFWCKDALEIIHAPLNTSGLEGSVAVMNSTTEKGLSLYMFRQGAIDDLSAKYRFSIWAKGTLNCPEAAGVVLDGQS